jgi:hypothetical protein
MVRRFLSLLAVSSLLAASAAFAQANGTGQRRQIPPPTNLKVLPKDTTGPQVIAIMRGFEGDLGVECTYCHAKDPVTNRPNFASDANPMKDRARVMIKMAHAINTEYLTQLDPKPDTQVTCGTCHRGMPEPTPFVPPPHEHPQAPAAAAPTTPPTPK